MALINPFKIMTEADIKQEPVELSEDELELYFQTPAFHNAQQPVENSRGNAFSNIEVNDQEQTWVSQHQNQLQQEYLEPAALGRSVEATQMASNAIENEFPEGYLELAVLETPVEAPPVIRDATLNRQQDQLLQEYLQPAALGSPIEVSPMVSNVMASKHQNYLQHEYIEHAALEGPNTAPPIVRNAIENQFQDEYLEPAVLGNPVEAQPMVSNVMASQQQNQAQQQYHQPAVLGINSKAPPAISYTEPRRPNIDHSINQFMRVQSQLKKHTISPIGKTPYKCVVCSKSFPRKYSLQRHSKIHLAAGNAVVLQNGCANQPENQIPSGTGEKLYNINKQGGDVLDNPWSNKVSSTGQGQTARQIVKSGVQRPKTHAKEFVTCDQCNRQLVKKSLTVHKRTHTGEKPYQCDICQKFFARPDTLKIHRRRHTGEKLHACNQCNYRGIRACDVTEHRLLKHS